jgi:hypothetical protein
MAAFSKIMFRNIRPRLLLSFSAASCNAASISSGKMVLALITALLTPWQISS